jgi:hypothetical protein
MLTKTLREISAKVFPKPIGIRLYRQLSIAITNRHIQWIAKPFKRHDDKSTTADNNVAFAWQSCHRPAQRAEHYALDGAFPTHLQPALLTMYKQVSIEWHRYHGHKSRDTTPFAKSQGLVHTTRSTTVAEERESIVSKQNPSCTPQFPAKTCRADDDYSFDSILRPPKRRRGANRQYPIGLDTLPRVPPIQICGRV